MIILQKVRKSSIFPSISQSLPFLCSESHAAPERLLIIYNCQIISRMNRLICQAVYAHQFFYILAGIHRTVHSIAGSNTPKAVPGLNADAGVAGFLFRRMRFICECVHHHKTACMNAEKQNSSQKHQLPAVNLQPSLSSLLLSRLILLLYNSDRCSHGSFFHNSSPLYKAKTVRSSWNTEHASLLWF